MTDYTALVTQIHAVPRPTVIEFAGAGSAALWHLHAVGGSSRTILEASDRYAPASMASLLGTTPEQFVSAETAVAMAHAAYRRACDLHPGLDNHGIGCTATIATDRTKRGDHACWVALVDATGVQTAGVVLRKGARDRAGEEDIVSALILQLMATARGLLPALTPPILPDESLEYHSVQQPDTLSPLYAGTVATVCAGDHDTFAPISVRDATVLSGSFNPLHSGHRALLTTAMAYTYQPGFYELSVVNADKPALPYTTALTRSRQFRGEQPLLLSRAPRFVDKASAMPGSTFVIGYDTAVRLLDPKYYPGSSVDAVCGEIAAHGCRFLVVGRVDGDGLFRQLLPTDIPAQWRGMFILLDEQAFRRDISSTQIRQGISSDTAGR